MIDLALMVEKRAGWTQDVSSVDLQLIREREKCRRRLGDARLVVFITTIKVLKIRREMWSANANLLSVLVMSTLVCRKCKSQA